MAEKRPSTSKRTTAPRPRRRTSSAATNGDDNLEHRTAEVPTKPAIEDAFEEAAAMRAEFDDRPTERDMDFEADERPARSARPPVAASGDEPAPRRAPRRRRTPASEVAAEQPPVPEAPRAESAREATRAESRPADDFEPVARFDAEEREPQGAEPVRNESTGYFADDSGGGPDGPDGGGDRRRRRRRRRGGRGQGGEQGQPYGGNPQGGGGYGRNQNRGRQPGPTHGGQRRQGGHQPQPRHQNQHSSNAGPRVEGPPVPVLGILELHPKGYGFIREAKAGYSSQETDPFVSSSIIQKLGLREGVMITGESVSGGRGQGPRLRQVDTIEGRTIEAWQQVRSFDELTAINPFEQIKLETGPTPITMRIMDLLTPIGKGQRALIVAPPRTGKTMLLQEIADSVSKNHPEIYLMVLLIDERPEEVTEMRRRVRGEVIASSMDREVESHVRVSQLMFERAKRMTESGRDVFILLDSITRTARAFNKWTNNTGRTMSGGLDVKAMDIPKKMFGTARRFEEGGSLTVVGTALIETGSRMDDVIFQEFKGTGNMEMVLSRDLADRRIWPAIDITKSGTRREEKILSPDVMEGVTLLRRSLVSMNPVEAMEQLSKTLAKFPSNAEFLEKVRSVL